MTQERINYYVEKFDNVKLVYQAVDILDEVFEKVSKSYNEGDSLNIIHIFFEGICIGESLNGNETFHWFTQFNEAIFNMFLDRHGYYLNNNKLIKK